MIFKIPAHFLFFLYANSDNPLSICCLVISHYNRPVLLNYVMKNFGFKKFVGFKLNKTFPINVECSHFAILFCLAGEASGLTLNNRKKGLSEY